MAELLAAADLVAESVSMAVVGNEPAMDLLFQTKLRLVQLDQDKNPQNFAALVTAVGIVIINAIRVRRTGRPRLQKNPKFFLGFEEIPRQTTLCMLAGGTLPDVLCSTDGKRHGFSAISSVPLEEAARRLLPQSMVPVNPSQQYIQFCLKKPDGSIVNLCTNILGHRLFDNMVPETFTVKTVGSHRFIFPLFFHEEGLRFSLVPHPGQSQAVYAVKMSFPLRDTLLDKISPDKSSVFLDPQTVENNLEYIAKTVELCD